MAVNYNNRNIFEMLDEERDLETLSQCSDITQVTEVNEVAESWEEDEPMEEPLHETWPELGAKVSPIKKSKPFFKPNPKPEKFILGHSRIAELKRANAQLMHPEDPRSKAFERINNKEVMRSRLTKTKACHFVVPKDGEEKFGVCYRKVCTFAHGMDEFRLTECEFGDICNRIDGSFNRRTGRLDETRKCHFYHPTKETVEQYWERTGLTPPNLPATSEHSHKPTEKKFIPSLGKPKQSTLKAPALKINITPQKQTFAEKIQALKLEDRQPTPLPSPTNTKTVLRIPAEKLMTVLDQLGEAIQQYEIVVE